MKPRYLGAVIVSVALWGAAGEARGDVAPPPDYADPCDSVVLDASCRRCTAPEFKARECHASAREAGLTARCSGWGYTMYCGEPSAQPPPQPPGIAEPPAPDPWPAVPSETPGPVAVAQAPESALSKGAIAAGQGSEPAPAVADKRGGCAIVSRPRDPGLLVWLWLGLGLGLGLGLRRRRRRAA